MWKAGRISLIAFFAMAAIACAQILLGPIENTPYIGGNFPGDVTVNNLGKQVLIKHNLAAAVAPTTTDDTSAGYAVGSRWINTTADKSYLCVDATASSAIWQPAAIHAASSVTMGAAATTFAVENVSVFTVTGDAGANTIATITGAAIGQRLTLIHVDGLVSYTDDNSHAANSIDLSAAYTSADDSTLTLVFDGTSWYETSRSTN